MNDKKRGTCAECGEDFQIKKDGTLYRHSGLRVSSWSGRREWLCAGAGKPPVWTQGEN